MWMVQLSRVEREVATARPMPDAGGALTENRRYRKACRTWSSGF